MNHKRVHRVYREAGLMIRRKKRKHCVRVGKPLVARTSANQEWALDFVHDAVECGRAIRVLSVVDAYTRECLALEVDTSFASRRVTRVLDAIVAERGTAAGDPLRQRAGTDQPAFSGVVRGTADRVSAHSAGQADAERTSGEFSRTAAGRVFDGELVSEPVRCAAEDRGVEDRVQRRASAQQLGIQNPERVCGGSGSRLLQQLSEGQGTQTPSLAPRAPPSRLKPEMEQQKVVVFLRERKLGAGGTFPFSCRFARITPHDHLTSIVVLIMPFKIHAEVSTHVPRDCHSLPSLHFGSHDPANTREIMRLRSVTRMLESGCCIPTKRSKLVHIFS